MRTPRTAAHGRSALHLHPPVRSSVSAHGLELERAIPVVLITQGLCLPCLIGMAFAMPIVGVVTLVAYVVVFVVLGLAGGSNIDRVRRGRLHWIAVALGTVAVGALLWACATAGLPQVVGVPLAASLACSTILLLVVHHRRRRLPEVHCRACGYDMRGAVDDACPECGAHGQRELG